MKRITAIILITFMIISTACVSVYADDENKIKEIIEEVDKTNAKIQEEINKAIEKAEKEIKKLDEEVAILEKERKVVKLQNRLTELNSKLDQLDANDDKYDELLKEIQYTGDEIKNYQQNLDKIMKEYEKAIKESGFEHFYYSLTEEEFEEAEEYIEEITEKYYKKLDDADGKILEERMKFNQELNEIIFELIEKTNEEAAEMIEEAAEEGIVVECELQLVNIGGQEVWIDPLRIAGF